MEDKKTIGDFQSFVQNAWRRILRYKRHDVNVGSLISANFATAAVLISFGVVLGITSPL